jgi:hypothetical protein
MRDILWNVERDFTATSPAALQQVIEGQSATPLFAKELANVQ